MHVGYQLVRWGIVQGAGPERCGQLAQATWHIASMRQGDMAN